MDTGKNLLNGLLQNTRCPQGWGGRVMLRGMNCFHASLARRGMKHVPWQPAWTVLDIGCGDGANVKGLLAKCPEGQVHGIDLSEESVAFARRHNAKEAGRRCFIRQGNVCALPYEEGMFDAVTAFETVYFWSPMSMALKEVRRVLRRGGYFLISLEVGDPELGKRWSDRIEGMTVYAAEDLKRLLVDAGFSVLKIVQKKEETHIIACK